jgi:hypothetical protein
VAVTLLILGSVSAMAQSRASETQLNVPDAEAVRAMHEFATCVVREQEGEARRLLAMDFRTNAYRAALRQLATQHNRCVPSRGVIRFSGLLLAGTMAEHLFHRDHGNVDPAGLLAQRPADPEARSPSEQMSFCLVRRATGAARAVLAASPTSLEEAAAMHALRPVMSDCLAGAREARMNRPGLRSLIALAFHNLVGPRTAAN